MKISNQTKLCVQYIKKQYSDLTALSIEEIIELALQYGENDAHEHAAEWYKRKLEQEEKDRKEEEARKDYEEKIDDEGKVWYHRLHLYHQKDSSRKLKQGDIIQYKASMPGYEGESFGIMLVNSFDYKSDFACRSYFNFQINERYKKADKWEDRCKEKEDPYLSWEAGSAPSINAFSFASEQEIENFFITIKENWPDQYNFYFTGDYKFIPDYIKERYSKYLKYGK